jgi:hypothetical protein
MAESVMLKSKLRARQKQPPPPKELHKAEEIELNSLHLGLSSTYGHWTTTAKPFLLSSEPSTRDCLPPDDNV